MREWFVVANPAPCLPAHTGRAPEYKACWEEPPTTEEMAQVERLVKEIADLSVQGLTGATVATSFCRRLMQPIQGGSTRPSSTGVIRTRPGDMSARSPGKRLRTGSPASWRGRSGTRAAQKPTA